MSSRRTERAAEAIRETVSTAVLFELRDPRIRNVTVISAEVTEDLRLAKVYVSILGSAKQQALTMKGLEAARGFVQAKVADRLQTKNTPILKFVLYDGVKKSLEAARLLRESLPMETAGQDPADADAGGNTVARLDEVPEDETLENGVEEEDEGNANPH